MERQITLEHALQVWRDQVVGQETDRTHLATSELYDLATQQLSLAEAKEVLLHLRCCLPCREEWHTLLRHLAEDQHRLHLAAQGTPAPGLGQPAHPTLMPQEARQPGRPPEEATPASHLRLLNTQGAGTEHRPSARWYGGSTEPLTDFVSLERLAASSAAGATPVWLFRSQDGLVTATVRLTIEGQIAVALETQDPQCAVSRWGFRFARADGTELYSAAMTLQLSTEQSGLWEGRVEIDLILAERWGFTFYSLPNAVGDMP